MIDHTEKETNTVKQDHQKEHVDGADFSNPVADQRVEATTYDNYPSDPHQESGGQLVGEVERSFTLSLNVSVNETGVVALIFAASLIVLISVARSCADVDNCAYSDTSIEYGITVGLVSMILSGVHILASKYKPALVANSGSFVSLFLLIWWGFGAGIMTFKEPFQTVGNGYFASWLGFIMSGSFALQSVNWLSKRTTGMKAVAVDRAIVFLILMASVIEIVAASVLCDGRDSCENDYAFAVAAGVISVCVCLVYMVAGGALPVNITAGFLGLWWMIATGVLTFDDRNPFADVGNGYFAVWSCFLGSFYFCGQVFLGDMTGSA